MVVNVLALEIWAALLIDTCVQHKLLLCLFVICTSIRVWLLTFKVCVFPLFYLLLCMHCCGFVFFAAFLISTIICETVCHAIGGWRWSCVGFLLHKQACLSFLSLSNYVWLFLCSLSLVIYLRRLEDIFRSCIMHYHYLVYLIFGPACSLGVVKSVSIEVFRC